MSAEDENRLEQLRSAWIQGGSARPLIVHLIEMKRADEAGALARLALAADACPDREKIEELLQPAGSPPPGWSDSVLAFSRSPTPDNWDNIMRFTPNRENSI